MPRGRDDRVYERGSDRSGERRRDWDRDRGGRERSRERGGAGRDRERTREVSKEQDGGRDRERTRDVSREQDGGRDRERTRDMSREQDAGRDRERTREASREQDGGGRHRRERDSRYRAMSPVHSRHPRSQSPRKTHRHESPNQDSRLPHSSHDLTKSSSVAPVPPPNEEMRDGASVEERADVSLPKDSLAIMQDAEAALAAKEIEKEKPSFEYSGKLAAETNKVRGVTLQFTEPPEARKPTVRWRLYVFKDGEALNDPLYIHRQTCYLFGRERRVADIPTDHPSCSKQHAVIQFRLTEKEEPDGAITSKVRPYIMDLGSTNGTSLNGKHIDPQRYYELLETDTIKFGNSSREYVLLHEHSTG